jgi:hypothetical protein
MMSDEDEIYIKFVVLDEIYNFIVQIFLIWDRLDVQIFKIYNLNFSNDLGWRNDQNKNYRSQKVMQLCSSQLFHLK